MNTWDNAVQSRHGSPVVFSCNWRARTTERLYSIPPLSTSLPAFPWKVLWIGRVALQYHMESHMHKSILAIESVRANSTCIAKFTEFWPTISSILIDGNRGEAKRKLFIQVLPSALGSPPKQKTLCQLIPYYLTNTRRECLSPFPSTLADFTSFYSRHGSWDS